MTTRALVVAVLIATAAGCVPSEPNPLRSSPMPADIGADCDLAVQRCSRCHTIDRVLHARITEPAEWRRYVHRMRLMPSSAIEPHEELPISRCLVFRTSGSAGLSQLEVP